MEVNPYAPPSADSDAPGFGGSGEPLFIDNQVALATFFGSPIAGFIALAINERRMGRDAQFGKTIGIGVVASAIVIGLAFTLPDEVPPFLITLAYLFGMRELARRWQGEEVMARLSNGTPKGSNWTVFGIGIACLAGLFIVGFAAGTMFPSLIPE